MERYHYAGLDVHRKIIAYCVTRVDGTIVDEGKMAATRRGGTGCLQPVCSGGQRSP